MKGGRTTPVVIPHVVVKGREEGGRKEKPEVNKVQREGNFLNLIKGIYEKSTAHRTLKAKD